MQLVADGNHISQVDLPSFLQLLQNFLYKNPSIDILENAAHSFIFLKFHGVPNTDKIPMQLADLIQEILHKMMVHFIGVVHESQFEAGSFGQYSHHIAIVEIIADYLFGRNMVENEQKSERPFICFQCSDLVQQMVAPDWILGNQIFV